MSLPEDGEVRPSRDNKLWLVVGFIVCLLIGLFVGHAVTYHVLRGSGSFSTPYQAVLLSNGSVYYGKLSGYGGGHPMLTDVYYIITKTDPDTKQVTNVLVKRGKELHGPDRMWWRRSPIRN